MMWNLLIELSNKENKHTQIKYECSVILPFSHIWILSTVRNDYPHSIRGHRNPCHSKLKARMAGN